MNAKERAELVGRRGELLAELFLQDLRPAYLGRAELANAPYDFFVGFPSERGGINTFAVEVKTTENLEQAVYAIPKRLLDYLALANIPVILLVADAKNNRLFYAWGDAIGKRTESQGDAEESVRIPLTLLDEKSLPSFKQRLAA